MVWRRVLVRSIGIRGMVRVPWQGQAAFVPVHPRLPDVVQIADGMWRSFLLKADIRALPVVAQAEKADVSTLRTGHILTLQLQPIAA